MSLDQANRRLFKKIYERIDHLVRQVEVSQCDLKGINNHLLLLCNYRPVTPEIEQMLDESNKIISEKKDARGNTDDVARRYKELIARIKDTSEED